MSSVIESYVLRVTDLDQATEFWEKGIGAEVVSRIGERRGYRRDAPFAVSVVAA